VFYAEHHCAEYDFAEYDYAEYYYAEYYYAEYHYADCHYAVRKTPWHYNEHEHIKHEGTQHTQHNSA
jgi:hypothetical protein